MTVSLKEGPLVLVTDDAGDVPADGTTTFGLYYHDMRYVSAFELRINGKRPLLLSANGDENYVATFQLVNPRLEMPEGEPLPAQTLSIRRTRFVADSWRERIGILNCAAHPVELELSLRVDGDFRDMFAVRGHWQQDYAEVERRPGRTGADLLSRGADGMLRETRIRTEPPPATVAGRDLRYPVRLAPQDVFSLEVRFTPYEDGRPPLRLDGRTFDRAVDAVRSSYGRFLRASTRFATSRELFDRELLQRSALDLRALLDFEPTGPYPTAGIPWYATPFGRDAIVTAFQTLCYNPDVALGTLRLLAKHQGTKVEPASEEEPGKIFHELRRGVLARLGTIPKFPYYGTADATPLFVCLFVETVRWLGDGALYRELLPNAEAALAWCDTYGDRDGDGFIEYGHGEAALLRNQGWKDSGTSLSYRDGTAAELPAALVEVQAYVYAAKRGLAELADHFGDTTRAATLRREAEELRDRFEDAFWIPEERCYAQALDGRKRRVDAVTSNAGHALWSGIASPERAALLVERLMERDAFTGWGIRTLSSSYPTYNPMSYHNGSVWAHDNSLIAAGMARYGHREAANRIVTGIVDAGLRFPNARLPELFCGFARDLRFSARPADYVVSCMPQAWSAAAPFLFLQTVLGLRVDLAGERVVIDPVLPEWLGRIDLRGMRALGRRYTFRVRRTRAGVRISGDLSSRRTAVAP